MRRTAVVACLLLIVLATGCTRAMAGAARPAPGLTLRPLTGETIKRVLLDGSALSQLLAQPFDGKADLPPRFGGPEKLQTSSATVSPVDCAGIARLGDKSAYGSAQVKNVPARRGGTSPTCRRR